MSSSKTLLGKFNNLSHTIKPNDHLVHIYEHRDTLVDSVCNFVVPGLTSADGIIIIATKENSTEFIKSLERRSIDVPKAKLLGQLLILDAHETLKKIMSGGELDPLKFETVIGSVLQKLTRKHSQVRAYGEIVSILWNNGDEEKAIQLEKLWNDLATRHNFALLCGYQFHDEKSSKAHPCYSDVCNSHSHVITTDGHLSLYRR